MNNIIDSFLEIRLGEPNDFLKIKETLTRIGIASHKDKTLYQSCHILHKQGRFYIVHFKEMFALDGKKSNFDETDEGRRNTIAFLLRDWNLLEICEPDRFETPRTPLNMIKILSFKEKSDWTLISKYNIGNKNS